MKEIDRKENKGATKNMPKTTLHDTHTTDNVYKKSETTISLATRNTGIRNTTSPQKATDLRDTEPMGHVYKKGEKKTKRMEDQSSKNKKSQSEAESFDDLSYSIIAELCVIHKNIKSNNSPQADSMIRACADTLLHVVMEKQKRRMP